MYRVLNIYTGEVAFRGSLEAAVEFAKGCSYQWQVSR